MSVEHRMEVTYYITDDGIHLVCKCGEDVKMGFWPSVTDLVVAEDRHMKEVLAGS